MFGLRTFGGSWPQASGGGGALYVDTLKNNRARTVPLVLDLVPIVDRWSAGKGLDAWLFSAPRGGPLRESNWKRSVGWSAATSAVGVPGFRVHDLRHTAASVWLAAGADPKVVQRVLGHATAAMTMDLYGHIMDANLWQAARLLGGFSGTSRGHLSRLEWRSKMRTTSSRAEIPGSRWFSSGAAYRNRTDDLRITRDTVPARARAGCTDSTRNGTDGTRGAGIIRRPGPRPGPCVPASCHCA